MTLQIFPDALISNFSTRSHSEQFASDSIIVILEWTISLSQVYYRQLLLNASVQAVPYPVMIMVYTGNRTFQLTLLYNIQYNVSLTQPGICGQPNQAIVIELSYGTYFNVQAVSLLYTLGYAYQSHLHVLYAPAHNLAYYVGKGRQRMQHAGYVLYKALVTEVIIPELKKHTHLLFTVNMFTFFHSSIMQ